MGAFALTPFLTGTWSRSARSAWMFSSVATGIDGTTKPEGNETASGNQVVPPLHWQQWTAGPKALTVTQAEPRPEPPCSGQRQCEFWLYSKAMTPVSWPEDVSVMGVSGGRYFLTCCVPWSRTEAAVVDEEDVLLVLVAVVEMLASMAWARRTSPSRASPSRQRTSRTGVSSVRRCPR